MATPEGTEEGRRSGSADARLRSDYCVFLRGGSRFALSTRIAREVLDGRPFTLLPRGPGELIGAFNLRGEVIALACLDRFLGVPQRPLERGDGLLVLADGEIVLATLVDGVEAVRHIAPWEIQRLPAGERESNALVRGTVGKEHELVRVLDGERLLVTVAAHVASSFRGRWASGAGAVRDGGMAPPPAAAAEAESVGGRSSW